MRRRQGFTLVELMVAMALIVLIMAIISQAFVEGLETFRQLKGIGDMQERLRTAVVPLREDLMATHLVAGGNATGNGPLKLSQLGPPSNLILSDGFFRIEQTSLGSSTIGSVLEGTDSDGVPSYSATNHALLFTIYTAAEGKSPSTQFLSTLVPASTAPNPLTQLELQTPPNYQQRGQFLSPWAEIAWFLVPMTDPATGGSVFAAGGNTPLFTLNRRVRLLVQTNTTINTVSPRETNLGLYPEVSCEDDPQLPGSLFFNSSKDVVSLTALTPPPPAPHRGGMSLQGTTPNQIALINRTPLGSGPEGSSSTGLDRVLADVISFQVQVLTAGNVSFTDVGNGGFYDTGAPPTVNQPIRALQITIRVWDFKTEQARQITVIQDM